MTAPTTAEMLALLNAACPAWLTMYGNAHRAVAALSPTLDGPYAQWSATADGQRLSARRDYWEALWAVQLAEKGRDFQRERVAERDEVDRGLKLFTPHTFGAAVQYSLDEGLVEA